MGRKKPEYLDELFGTSKEVLVLKTLARILLEDKPGKKDISFSKLNELVGARTQADIRKLKSYMHLMSARKLFLSEIRWQDGCRQSCYRLNTKKISITGWLLIYDDLVLMENPSSRIKKRKSKRN